MFRRAEISSGIKKALFQAEGKRLSAYENRIFDYFNHHCIISEQDRNLINHPSKDKIVVIENGIDRRFFEILDVEQKYDLVFTGNMNYPPNIECAEYLVNEILPLLPASTTVLLSGASPHQRIHQLASENKVKVTGWVDDIRISYASAKIFVAPLFIGTGLQNKLLEAMAMGLPAVTTPLANNALNAEASKEIMLAENAQGFADQIKLLLDNNAAASQMGQAGKRFVEANYSWSESIDKLDKLLSASNQNHIN
jgi:glycosyltransferase involved in cell wall biosynthesis